MRLMSDVSLALVIFGLAYLVIITERIHKTIVALSGAALMIGLGVVTQDEARDVAADAGCYLEGLGGTNQGIIGALSAIALACGRDDGRVVHIDGWPWPDHLTGVQPVATIRQRVTDIRLTTGEPFAGDRIDLGKHLRPNWRAGRIVLLVEPAPPGETPRAARLK